jgi:hypothetical protein
MRADQPRLESPGAGPLSARRRRDATRHRAMQHARRGPPRDLVVSLVVRLVVRRVVVVVTLLARFLLGLLGDCLVVEPRAQPRVELTMATFKGFLAVFLSSVQSAIHSGSSCLRALVAIEFSAREAVRVEALLERGQTALRLALVY